MHGRSRHVEQGDLPGTGWANPGGIRESRPGRSQSTHISEEVPETGWSEGVQEGGSCKDMSNERKPAKVSEMTKQAGEARPTEWGWMERSVWTERMLEALEKGVKGGVWFSLIDKIYRPSTLKKAWKRVKTNKGSAGSDNQSIKDFQHRLEKNLLKLSEELRTGSYRPRPIRRRYIKKGGY